MSPDILDIASGSAGAFGVNYALRPHKFVDRRVFMEVINRFTRFRAVHDHTYVGLGSFALEDHKLMHSTFGTRILISLEIDPDVLARQKFNSPLSCIKPTIYSTTDFVTHKRRILDECGTSPDSSLILWFDMTDDTTLRANLDVFGEILRISKPYDIVRITIDIDEKIFGRKDSEESLEQITKRRFEKLRELLGDDLKPGTRALHITRQLGIARLVSHAFKLVAEKAFETGSDHQFEPLSITTYADGHRMLSITGAVVRKDEALSCRTQMGLDQIPGSVQDWSDLVEIRLPQLTVWEKLQIDRDLPISNAKTLSKKIDFRLHESIPTIDLLDCYSKFQRFYPTFRHVLF